MIYAILIIFFCIQVVYVDAKNFNREPESQSYYPIDRPLLRIYSSDENSNGSMTDLIEAELEIPHEQLNNVVRIQDTPQLRQAQEYARIIQAFIALPFFQEPIE